MYLEPVDINVDGMEVKDVDKIEVDDIENCCSRFV